MKKFSAFILAAILLSTGATVVQAIETGSAYQVLRVPSGGGFPKYGQVDLSQGAAVTGTLPVARGGTGVTSSTGSGSVVLSAAPTVTGDWIFDTDTLIVDSTNNRIGIGTTTPSFSLDTKRTLASGNQGIRIFNQDNTSSTSHAVIEIRVGGTSGGNPKIHWDGTAQDWSAGSDNGDSGKWKIARGSLLGTNTAFTIDTSNNITAGTASSTWTGALVGNASTATTATTAGALTNNPSDCSAGQKATAIDASGNLTCSAVSLTADVSGLLPKANGGTGADNSSVTYPSSGTVSTLEATATLSGQKSFSLAPLPTTNYAIGAGVDLGSTSFLWKDLYLGHQVVYTGVQPTSVGTTPGTAADSLWSLTAAVGGNTTIATTGVGGVGEAISQTAGTGGTANSAATASTGGAGGAAMHRAGDGGGSSVAGTGTNTGGVGGGADIRSGSGGAASGASSGLVKGGAGGLVRAIAGNGGAASAGTGSVTGGAGGESRTQPGIGGAATGAGTGTNTGGAAGVVTLDGQAGGAATGAITGSNVGGVGTIVNINGGAGGAANSASVANTSGAGGGINLTAGRPGTASGTGAVTGAEGTITMTTAGTARLTINGVGGLVTGGSAPTVGTCGGTPSITGNDTSGTITIGSGGTATACTVTFAATKTSTPKCFVNDTTDAVTPWVSARSTTAFTVTKATAFTAGAVVDYFCVQ